MAVTYEPIATTTLGSANTTITFSSIPGTYTDLRLIVVGKVTGISTNNTYRFNSDTGTNYSRTRLLGDGATASSDRTTSATSITDVFLGSTTNPHLAIVDIFSYAGSTNKTVLTLNSSDDNGSGYVGRGVGLWRNTAAITTITIANNGTFDIGTTATLYGILKA